MYNDRSSGKFISISVMILLVISGLTITVNATSTNSLNRRSPIPRAIGPGWTMTGYDIRSTYYDPVGSTLSTPISDYKLIWNRTCANCSDHLLGDVDGDSKLEIVTTNMTYLQIFNGSGVLKKEIDCGMPVTIGLLIDVDDDNQLEMFVNGVDGSTLHVLGYTYSGIKIKDFVLSGKSDSGITVRAILDMDMTGTYELIAAVGTGYGLKPRGIVCFAYTSETEEWYYAIGPSVAKISIGDFTGDSKLEMVIATNGPANGNSDNGFDDSHSYAIALDDRGNPIWNQQFEGSTFVDSDSLLKDTNSDGKDEVFASSMEHGVNAWDGSLGRVYQLDGGNGGVLYQNNIGIPVDASAIADIDSDGYYDLLATYRDGNTHTGKIISFNTRMQEQNEYTLPSSRLKIIGINDINGDDYDEIVAISLEYNRLIILDRDLNEIWNYTVPSPILGGVISDFTDSGVNNILIYTSDHEYAFGNIIKRLPDLKVTPPDITFSNPTPMEDDSITISATVHNIGIKDALGVKVTFFCGTAQIGANQTNASISKNGGTALVSVPWIAVAGTNTIKVKVDPDNTIEEFNESNNEASRGIMVAKAYPDLTVLASEISFSNPHPLDGDPVTISAIVHNIGIRTAFNVKVTFLCGSVRIGSNLTIANISKADFFGPISVPWMAVVGTQTISVKVDPDNTITEFNESNNEATKTIVVASAFPDLTVSPPDITLSIQNPTEGDLITISATVHNIGIRDAQNVHVVFYTGLTQVGPVMNIASLPRSSGTAQVSVPWTAVSGMQTIRVKVDPDNAIIESNESNNEATKALTVASALPDLTVSTSDLKFSNNYPVEGDHVKITVTVHNIGIKDVSYASVRFFCGLNQISQDLTVLNVLKNDGTGQASVTWTAVAGVQTLRVKVDPDNYLNESNETNNEAKVTLDIPSRMADLTIVPENINFSDPNPKVGEVITISVIVRNIGQDNASKVLVRIFDGSTQIGPDQTIAYIGNNGGSGKVTVVWKAVIGVRAIKVIADPENTISETNEMNNEATNSITVISKPTTYKTMLETCPWWIAIIIVVLVAFDIMVNLRKRLEKSPDRDPPLTTNLVRTEPVVKDTEEPAPRPRKTSAVRCPRCQRSIRFEPRPRPFKVQCPYCGKTGMIK